MRLSLLSEWPNGHNISKGNPQEAGIGGSNYYLIYASSVETINLKSSPASLLYV